MICFHFCLLLTHPHQCFLASLVLFRFFVGLTFEFWSDLFSFYLFNVWLSFVTNSKWELYIAWIWFVFSIYFFVFISKGRVYIFYFFHFIYCRKIISNKHVKIFSWTHSVIKMRRIRNKWFRLRIVFCYYTCQIWNSDSWIQIDTMNSIGNWKNSLPQNSLFIVESKPHSTFTMFASIL